ncbi:trypsin-like serine protease [Streptomonospora sp. S1-112]|uniref:Trypsin-like serine protease n=1 Tax=Streptomonospora mangrovi TaxID=2883123 RepID=A0A9X3NFP5_9ACTN|nr:trypsin-like serine protease [Streptomonospora mangrovi]MDA0562759.1 trypsin-like serine protease [Streptomonospora mangrovi]
MTSSVVSRLVGALAGAGAALAVAGVLAVPGAAADTPATGVPGSGTAGSAPHDPGGVVRQAAAVDPDSQRRVLDYWTPERMAAAVPLVRTLDGVAGGLLGGDQARPGGQAAAEAEPGGQVAVPQAAAASSTGEPWTGGGRVAKTTGKVFLTLDGRDFTCSAAVVSADNRDTVITAGHCLKDGTGAWVDNWTFAPGYADGDSPYGRYTARQMFVAPQWADSGDDSYDFGMAVLNRSGDRHVQDRTGAHPVAFNTAPGDPTYAFGYPATGRFDGNRLHYCAGGTKPDTGGTTASGMACTMTEGSSGGPWLAGFDPASGKGTVVSVISFKYADDTRTQYGPYLGDAAQRVYDRAQSF